ncbi:YceK/YidQ family lipoprotein [Vibrio owensii]|uniref:YceK/YidQ family lipoprotein n=1 Tax=Vibrio owensii TaxID=696485 RepID=UPI0038CE2DB5
MYKKTLILLFVISLGGVSSWEARLNGRWGEPYYGYTHARYNFVYCGIGKPLITGKPVLLIYFPITLLDMLGSTVVDTALLPVDLVVKDTHVIVQRRCRF